MSRAARIVPALAVVALLSYCVGGGPTRQGPPAVTPTPSPTGATPTPSQTGATPTPGGTPGTPAAYLRQQKNRTQVPDDYVFFRLDSMFALPEYSQSPTAEELADIERRERTAAYVEGELVYYIRVGDGGTYGRPNANGDWHLEVREPRNLTRTQTIEDHVVCEITPHFQEQHPGWGEDEFLRRHARFHDISQINPKGSLVRLYGLLMYDFPHADTVGFDRGTAWEIHPITKIEVFDEQAQEWVEIP